MPRLQLDARLSPTAIRDLCARAADLGETEPTRRFEGSGDTPLAFVLRSFPDLDGTHGVAPGNRRAIVTAFTAGQTAGRMKASRAVR